MGEYEPNDSRNVTQKKGNVPGEPARTGPQEDATRDAAKAREKREGDDLSDRTAGVETVQPADPAQAAYGNSRDEQGRKESDMKDRQQS